MFRADVARVTRSAADARPAHAGGRIPRWILHEERGSPRPSSGPRSATGGPSSWPTPDRPSAWTLLIDGTAQSHVDLADPTHLEFEYVRRTGHLLDALDPAPPAPLRVLHLGGGAWTLPRYVAATRPGSAQRVVELDGALVDLVRARLPADGLGLDVHVADARAGLDRGAAGLVRRRAARRVRRRPDPRAPDLGGVPAAASHGCCARAGATPRTSPTARAPAHWRPGGPRSTSPAARPRPPRPCSPEVAVVAAPDVLHGRRFGNVVLVAGGGDDQSCRWTEVARRVAADPFPARVEPGEAFAATAAVVTDGRPSPRPGPRGACSGSERGSERPVAPRPRRRCWLCSSSVSAKHDAPSGWQRTKYCHGPSAGASAASIAAFPGAAIGVGGRPATA